jgi:hypothetical protein
MDWAYSKLDVEDLMHKVILKIYSRSTQRRRARP